MIIDTLNLNHLRIFECVYRTRSMTAASKELHLTQSGVSQHIKSLEDVLGVKLFDRIKQKLIPTPASATLFRKTADSLYGIEQTLTELKGGEQQLSGSISIGMPIEFGNNIVMPLLAKFCRQHPRVRFALRYGFPTEMNAGILGGDLDFAFVDAFELDPRITTERVFDETLVLCCHPKIAKEKGPIKGKQGFETLEYVDYQPGEPVLRAWFHHHLGSRNLKLNVRATVMDVQGVARLIQSGAAVGILPEYLVDQLEKVGGELHRFKGSGTPLKNTISVAWLPERTVSPAAAAAMKWFLNELRPDATGG
ncbi:MAG TPA: LysR family transcriptional regulator [Bdellovibrionota bacterium]|nr:LysR family transcriptional regulator [Bdellovibrionota bacterium]